MASIFDKVFTAEQKMPPAELQVWVNSIRSKNKTGILRLRTSSNEPEFFFLCRAGWYSISSKDSGNALDEWLQSVTGDVQGSFSLLSHLGMSHYWTALNSVRYQITTMDGIKSLPLNSAEPYLVKMNLDGAEGSILYKGFSDLPHSLFISENTLLDEVGIPEKLLYWKNDPACQVSIFPFDPALESWQIIALRKAFKILYDRILERCEKQTGRSIVASFARIIALFSAEQSVNVSVEGSQWFDRDFYPSTEEAAYYYRLALNELLEHFSAVLGPRLLSSNLLEAYALMSAGNREVLQKNTIIPEGFLS